MGDVFHCEMDCMVIMKKKSKKYKHETCLKCLKTINTLEEKYVLLGTYEGNDPLNESYFHIQCWKVYFNDCCLKKIQNAQQKVMGIIGGSVQEMIKGANLNGRTV